MTVDELIAGWSQKERDDLKDLIDDCREREKVIREAREKSLKGIEIIEMEHRGQMAELIWAVIANHDSIGKC
jgi:hypothetical protein